MSLRRVTVILPSEETYDEEAKISILNTRYFFNEETDPAQKE
jgi:hypothetical protein